LKYIFTQHLLQILQTLNFIDLFFYQFFDQLWIPAVIHFHPNSVTAQVNLIWAIAKIHLGSPDSFKNVWGVAIGAITI
jgi:hypothetical protein